VDTHELLHEVDWGIVIGAVVQRLHARGQSRAQAYGNAEDVVQEAAVRVLQERNPPQNAVHLRNWLIRSALDAATDAFRKHWPSSLPSGDFFVSPADNRWRAQMLYRCFDKLSPEHQNVINLVDFDGWTLTEFGRERWHDDPCSCDAKQKRAERLHTEALRALARLLDIDDDQDPAVHAVKDEPRPPQKPKPKRQSAAKE
jgi:hypothetical protein